MQNVPTPEVNQEAPNKKLGLFALIGVLLVTVLGGGVYYFGFAGNHTPPSLPSQGGLQGFISDQSTGFYKNDAADERDFKSQSHKTLSTLTAVKGVGYAYVTEKTNMKDQLETGTKAVKDNAFMYAYYDNGLSKFITTQQTVKNWAAATKALTGTDASTGKGVLEVGRGLIFVTNVKSLEAYNLNDASVEPSAEVSKAAMDNLVVGWNLVPFTSADFSDVMKNSNFTSLWMLDATKTFVEVPKTFDVKDLKNYVFWVEYTTKPSFEAAAVDNRGGGTLQDANAKSQWNHSDLTVSWASVPLALKYNITIDGGTPIPVDVGTQTTNAANADKVKVVYDSAKKTYVASISGQDVDKDHTVKFDALDKDGKIIAQTPETTVKTETVTTFDDKLAVTTEPMDGAVKLMPTFDAGSHSVKAITLTYGLPHTSGVKATLTAKADGTYTKDPANKDVSWSAGAHNSDIITVSGLTNDKTYSFNISINYESGLVSANSVDNNETPKKGGAVANVVEITATADWDAVDTKNIIVTWSAVESATKYAVTVDADTYTVDAADGTTTADPKKAESKGVHNDYTLIAKDLDTTKDHTVKVEAYKDAEVVATKDIAVAKQAAAPVGDVTVDDALAATATGGDKMVAIKLTKLEINLASPDKDKFKGLNIAYNDGTDKSADLVATYDAVKKVYTFPAKSDNVNVTWDEKDTITISGLVNDSTEQLFRVSMVYDTGYKSTVGSVTVKAVVNAAAPAVDVTVDDDSLVITAVASDKSVQLNLEITQSVKHADKFTGLHVEYTGGAVNKTADLANNATGGYDADAANADVSYTGGSHPFITVAGLTNDTEYTFKVSLTYDAGFVSGAGVVEEKSTPKAPVVADPLTASAPHGSVDVNTLAAQEYDGFTFDNNSDSQKIKINGVFFSFIQGDCSYIKNLSVKEVKNSTGTCSTHPDASGVDVATVGFTDAFTIDKAADASTPTTVAFTPVFDIKNEAKGKSLQLALTKVDYEDDTDGTKVYSLDASAAPLKGKTFKVDAAAASLNYGFASIFDTLLDSLFNLFR